MNVAENHNDHEAIQAAAKEALCYGLIKRIAARKFDNKKIHASEATHSDNPFYCPECYSDAFIRKCKDKQDHFAHHARQSPILRNTESALHLQCKQDILSGLNANFPNGNWALERTLEADKVNGFSKVVPDISGRINGRGIIIEVQKSAISIDKIIKRTLEYKKRGGYILWIIPLREELGTENFRPRLFEKFLHQMYYGRIYYWVNGNGTKLFPVHFSPSYCWIEERSWYDAEDMEHKEVGGYWKRYRTVRRPEYGRLIDIAEVADFKIEDAKAWEHKNQLLSIPSRKIYHDTLKKWWNDLPPNANEIAAEELLDDYFDSE